MHLIASLVSGIIACVVGIFCVGYAYWTQSFLLGLIGASLIMCFWRHAAFYVGLQGIAMHVCREPKTAGLSWKHYSKRWIECLFNVEVRNKRTYNTPVIFVVNHLAKSRPFDEFCLALIDQPRLRIVAVPRKPENSYPDIIMKSSNYVPVTHGSGYDMFMKQCEDALREGSSLLIFPEGRKTEEQTDWRALADFQSGVFDLALKTKTRVVPIVLEGFQCPEGWIRSPLMFAKDRPFCIHYLNPIDPIKHPKNLKHVVRNEMLQKLQSLV
jgi:1-acyl-sn-glycerol-3-phosphate acyltransferase